jgi:CheY-like chemotaxis protein
MKAVGGKDRKRLLLIDDDPNLILLVKDYLEFRGYEVVTADNGKEALNLLSQNLPDMIVCDIMMPEMDGYALIENVRQAGFQSCFSLLEVKAKIGSRG